MIEEVRKDILDVLGQLLKILKAKRYPDISKLKLLSNKVSHCASLFQDKAAISVAVSIYALAKILEKQTTHNLAAIHGSVSAAHQALQRKDERTFMRNLRQFIRELTKLDRNVTVYIDDVLTHAQIKKGCKICEHGVSCAQTAALLDITQWELMQYLGKSSSREDVTTPTDIKSKMGLLREMFT